MYRTMDARQLHERLQTDGPFRLCMIAPEWQYNAKHIPGSICVSDQRVAMQKLRREEEIIVYCSTHACAASREAARKLVEAGYANVWHFMGGLSAWESEGFPLEGDSVGGDG